MQPSKLQSTLVISNSLISNNRLSRSKNLAPVLTQRSTNMQQNIVKKRRNCSFGAISPLFQQNIVKKRRNCSFGAISPLFPQYFQYISNLGVKLKIHSVKGGCSINCFLQFRKSDMLKYGYLEVFHRVHWISR